MSRGANGDVTLTLSAEVAGFVSALRGAADQMRTVFGGMERDARAAGRGIEAAFSGLKIRSLSEIRAESDRAQVAFRGISSTFGRNSQEAQRAASALRDRMRELSAEASNTGGAFSRLGAAAGSLGFTGPIAAIAALAAAITGLKSVIDAGLGFEKIQSTMIVAFGSLEAANREFEFAKKVSNELGLELMHTAAGFAKFAASTKGSKLEGQLARDVFISVSKAAVGMRLSTEQVEGVFNALQQMMAKGKVQAEEFRGQLGDRLPLAMQAATRATGRTVEEFSKMLDDGKIISEEFLPAFAKALEEIVGDGAIQGAQSLQAQINRIKNVVQEFLIAVGQSGVMEAFNDQLKEWLESFKQLKESGELQRIVQNVADAIVTVGKAIAGSISFLVEYHKEIIGMVVAMGLIKLASVTAGFLAFAKAVGVATVAMRVFSALSLVGAITIGGAALASVYEAAKGFAEIGTSALDSIDPVEELQAAIKKVEAIDAREFFSAVRNAYAGIAKDVGAEAKAAIDAILDGERKASQAYSQASMVRLAQLAVIKQEATAAEEEIARKQKEIEARKTADAQVESRRRVESEIRSGEAKVSASQRVAGEQKKSLQQVAQAESAANRLAVSQHKEKTDQIKQQEEALKAQLVAVQARRRDAERQVIEASIADTKKRLDAIAASERQIASVVQQSAQAMARSQIQAAQDTRSEIARIYAQQGQDIASAMAGSQSILNQQNQERLNGQKGFLGAIKSLWTDEAAGNKAHADELLAIAQTGAAGLVAVKQKQVSDLMQELTRLETALAQSNAKIKGLEADLAATLKGFEDVKFGLSLDMMDDAGKFVALQQKAVQSIEEMRNIRAKAAAEGRAANDAERKQIADLGREVQGVARQIAALGKEGGDGVVSKARASAEAMKLLDAAAEQAGGSVRDAISDEKIKGDALKTQIDETKTAIQRLGDEIIKLKDIEIKITASSGDLEKIEGAIKQLQEMAGKEYVASLRADDTEARRVIENVQQKAKEDTVSRHRVQADTNQAQSAIRDLQRNTYSTHYVKVVEQRAVGGEVGGGDGGNWRRVSGTVRGPGTSTSDSVFAKLSRGEFVMRAAAVKKFGLGFMYALNAGFAPPVQHLALGGAVGSVADVGSAGGRDVVDLRFSVGGKQYTTQSSRDVAKGLAAALKEISRG